MDRRHMSNQLPGQCQHENNHPPAEQYCFPMVGSVATENGHFVTPMDHPIRGGAHSVSHGGLGGRSNEYHSSNINMEIQHLPPPFSRPPFDPYAYTSTNGNPSLAPMGPVGHIRSTHGLSESGGLLKRKAPCVFEGSSSSFYSAGGSSSSQMLIQEPAVDGLRLPPSNLSNNGQDWMRNVRRRSGPEWEPCGTSAHVPDYASRYYQPTTHSANYSVPVHPVNVSANGTGREWNIVPYAASYRGRTSHTDINADPRRGTSQFYAGRSSVDTELSHHNPFSRGNLASYSQNPHISHFQPIGAGHNYHHQRVTPFYTNGPTYCNYNNGGSYSTNELQFPSENVSSRYSRYSASGLGSGGYRDGGPRIAVERLQPLVEVIDSHDAFEHETVTDELPDEYHDMRLDIDNMSYEELLALEEKMGYVSSGLSEDGMSKCLREKVYYSMDQNQDTCPICLEEYKNGEKIGRMEKCGHEYHVHCIKKWVVMKKVCPICKSEC